MHFKEKNKACGGCLQWGPATGVLSKCKRKAENGRRQDGGKFPNLAVAPEIMAEIWQHGEKKHTKRGRIHTKKSKYCISALTPKHLRLQISICEGKQLYGVLPYGVTVIWVPCGCCRFHPLPGKTTQHKDGVHVGIIQSIIYVTFRPLMHTAGGEAPHSWTTVI